MLNKCTKFLINNKLIALLILFIFIAWGLIHSPFNIKIPFLPHQPIAVDAIPDIGENQQIIYTKWAGKSPQDIEDQITYPLSSALLGIPGVKTIRSSSMFGFSNIYLIFEEGVDFYWSRSRIIEKLNALPKGLIPSDATPSLGPDATGLGQVFWYTLEGRDSKGKVTGGWDLQELRSQQDYYVKYALSSTKGVSEVASIGGYVQEYQVEINPEKMRQYHIGIQDVVKTIKESNQEIGARTLEINQAEYFVRGLGYVKSIADLESAVIKSTDYTAITIQDIAKVSLGPAPRRGILDKEGAEVVGGVVVARYGENPMNVLKAVKAKIKTINGGLPSKVLKYGRKSQLTIVPFYDRSTLIKESIHTLEEALNLEILITILVILMMVFNLRASLLISTLLPIAVLMVFISMKLFKVDANIVALSGIAIAIGTMVDVGVILSENILIHLKNNTEKPINELIYDATSEVSGAILTAVSTTIISFLPVFTMIGSEGKLFRPLAFTKTMALISAVIVALFILPPLASILFKKRKTTAISKIILPIITIILGIFGIIMGYNLAFLLLFFGLINFINNRNKIRDNTANKAQIIISIITVVLLLTKYWNPLGHLYSYFSNLLFVAFCCFGLLGGFYLFQQKYEAILNWTLNHKKTFLMVPIAILILGGYNYSQTGKEFMPALDEGAFLLMPTSLPHSGVSENKRVLSLLDIAVANIPEIETVVGKAGRTESALDPAPISMYENIIIYKPEYLELNGTMSKFKTDEEGLFMLKNGKKISAFKNISAEELIPDKDGEYYRSWRENIKNTNDIWNEIVKATKLPGVTSAPKLQPIQTRLVMLQTGMRAPMGIKIKGQNLKDIEAFGLKLEKLLKEVEGVKKEAVFADRIVGKPYLHLAINREKLKRYGLSIAKVQQIIKTAIGGSIASQTIEGRERYNISVRYPRELRDSPDALNNIHVPLAKGNPIVLGELVEISYQQSAQVIKSEDTFLIGYVLFDKLNDFAEVNVVEKAQSYINSKIESGELEVPSGINFEFTGTYENQIRAEKTLSFVVPLALILIFLILYLQFRSIGISLMVFTSIAVAFSGGFIMIGLYGQDWFMNINIGSINLRDIFQIHPINLSVAVWVGFIALFGIATDDGVLMATYLKQSFENKPLKTQEDIRKAVIQAGKKRIRPCLMTTATTLLALLPILTSTGRGSDIMIPMAIPSFGGMFIALITLFVVPVLFCWYKELTLKKHSHEN